MTPSQLKYEHEKRFPGSCFFNRETMKFFGDTMRNFGVRKEEKVNTDTGDPLPVLVLYRKKPVKLGLNSSHYFDPSTFKRLFNVED